MSTLSVTPVIGEAEPLATKMNDEEDAGSGCEIFFESRRADTENAASRRA
ncbi:MAG: hypothetical protein ACYDE0_11350 [Acidiferrobacterales bacterium]